MAKVESVTPDEHCIVTAAVAEAEQHTNGEIVTVIAAEFGIRSIPTLLLFRDQIILYSEAGALPAMQLEQLIEQARALDMEAVRAEMAETAAKEAKG